jgi:hypothetical protein
MFATAKTMCCKLTATSKWHKGTSAQRITCGWFYPAVRLADGDT